MNNKTQVLYSVADPRELNFDITDDIAYLQKLVSNLRELNLRRPDKKYLEIFYQRYIKKYDISLICRLHSITEEELTFRLLDIVSSISKTRAA